MSAMKDASDGVWDPCDECTSADGMVVKGIPDYSEDYEL